MKFEGTQFRNCMCLRCLCVHERLYLTLLTCLLFNKLALLLSILDFAALLDSWRSRLCSATHSRYFISHFSSCRFIFYGQYPFGACGCFFGCFLETALAIPTLLTTDHRFSTTAIPTSRIIDHRFSTTAIPK